MEERYIATADLGTYKIALTVARITGANTEVIYYNEIPSEGIRYGSIFNPLKAAGKLRESVKLAEENLGIKIAQLVTSMPRGSVRQENAPASIPRSAPYSCILQEEVDSLKNITLDNYPLSDSGREEIYGAIAQSFSTDDVINANEEDIVGVPSEKLEGNFKIFVGAKRAVDNIYNMTNMLELGVARKYFLPEICGRAVLTEGEMENGVGLIEIGAGVTSISIFQNNILRYYSSIPFGGNSITSDIKMECNIKGSLAENIKRSFGACMPEKLPFLSEKTLMILNDEMGTSYKLPVKYLSEIVSCRMHEILQAVLFLVQESGYADKLRAGLVVTGGGANIINCTNYIKEESGYSVRVGYPHIKSFSITEDVENFGGTSSLSSVAMLMIAREDTHLNCAEPVDTTRKEAPARMVENTVPQPAAEKPVQTWPEAGAAMGEPVYEEPYIPENKPFVQESTPFVPESKPFHAEPNPAPKPEVKPKTTVNADHSPARPDEEEDRKKREPTTAKPSWGAKIVDKVENLMDKTFIGKLYDEMK